VNVHEKTSERQDNNMMGRFRRTGKKRHPKNKQGKKKGGKKKKKGITPVRVLIVSS